ncbi:MAG: glycosyltransferase family 4 protein [Anaerolineae bacterium]
MTILLLTGEFPPQQGGVGDYSNLLAQALIAQGQRVEIMTTRPAAADVQAPAAADALRPAVTVARWDWSAWSAVVAAIRQIQPAVVLIQYQTAAFGLHPAVNLLPGWLRLRLGRRRPRLITTFHDLKFPYLFPKAGPLRLAAVRYLARQRDAAVATNMEDWQTLRQWGMPAQEDAAPGHPCSAMIPIGSNIACAPPAAFERDAWRGAWGLGHNDWLLCYFGFLNASKGGEALIACLARLVQEGRPAHLVMIGGQVGSSDPTNQSYLEHVRRRIAELGLQGRVHWTGFVSADEVSAHLLAADVCVLPYQDGAGRSRGSLMAGLAHGLPIVTTQPAAPLPGFSDGVNVYFTPTASAETLAAAVSDIMTNPVLRGQLASGARTLSQQFTWPAIAGQHLRLIESLP